MKFEIKKIILWPRSKEHKYREIEFYSNKVNIITGASRTGKSAIIPIIDYCLGSSECTIPVDTIRDACEWFGLLINLGDGQLLICRKEPEDKIQSTEMYMQRSNKIVIPEIVKSNTNTKSVKDTLNEIFSMSFLEMKRIDEKVAGFASRPSYRDCMAFLFQPQNIVANSDVLFYKTETTEHRNKLKEIFPYVLGAITPEMLAKMKEIERKEKNLQTLERKYKIIEEETNSWRTEVESWLNLAYEYGFTDKKYNDEYEFEELIREMEEVSCKNVESAKILSKNIKDISDEIVNLKKEEKIKSAQLFELNKRYRDMKKLYNTANEYSKSLETQRDRLEITDWIKDKISLEESCPICGNNFNNAKNEIENLSICIDEIHQQQDKVGKIPVVFERELNEVQKEIEETTKDIENIQIKIGEKFNYIQQNNERQYTTTELARFLGKLENAVQTYKRIGRDSELENAILELNTEIANLKKDVDPRNIEKRKKEALEIIQGFTKKIVSKFDVEHPERDIQFDTRDLALKIIDENERGNYLSEIGSASNWLAYHISIMLAFQQYFQTVGVVKIPNFIVIDQPSQVYFPQISNKNYTIENEDKEAVRKIFKAMSDFIEYSNSNLQIIITEHAEEEIWLGIENTKLIERWRNGNKLVPLEWIEK